MKSHIAFVLGVVSTLTLTQIGFAAPTVGTRYYQASLSAEEWQQKPTQPGPKSMQQSDSVMTMAHKDIETPAERAISDKIRNAIHSSKELSNGARMVEVATKDGVVTLRGSVNSIAEKEKIERIAERTAKPMDGYKSIESQIMVTTPKVR